MLLKKTMLLQTQMQSTVFSQLLNILIDNETRLLNIDITVRWTVSSENWLVVNAPLTLHSEPRWHKASEPNTWNMVTRLKFYSYKTITESIFFLHLLLLYQCKICKVILSAQRSSCLIPQSFLQKVWGTCCQLFFTKYLCVGLWNIFICGFLRGNKISWRRGSRVGGYIQAFQILKINIFIAVSLS